MRAAKTKCNDFYENLDESGVIMVVTQLRKLADLIFYQVQDVYAKRGKVFKSPWFGILFSLRKYGEHDLKSLAQRISVKPPSASEVIKELEGHGFVKVKNQAKDARFKTISITKAGINKLDEIIPEIQFIIDTLKELFGDDVDDLLARLSYVENQLRTKSFGERASSPIKIVTYKPKYKKYLTSIYGKWLKNYYGLKKLGVYDQQCLENPQKYIIKPGGQIFFALDGDEVIGTLSLVHHSAKTAELSKLAVLERHRDKGAGKLLFDALMDYAKKQNYKEVVLYTNKTLKAAISLYKKYGFVKMKTPQEIIDKYGDFTNLSFKLLLS